MDKELKKKLVLEIINKMSPFTNANGKVLIADTIVALDTLTKEDEDKLVLEAKIKEKAELEQAIAKAQETLQTAVPRLNVLVGELPAKVEEKELIETPVEPKEEVIK